MWLSSRQCARHDANGIALIRQGHILNQRLVAEFTALVAAQAPQVIESGSPVSDALLWVYWQHGKTLLNRWRVDIQNGSHDTAADVLVAEMLTRVWGAVLTACDQRNRQPRCEAIARSLLTTHQQCRATALRAMLNSTTMPLEQTATLDRLRRRVERWTDLLVGPLIAKYGDSLADFAFDARRARDFGQDQLQTRFQSTSSPAWNFLLAGLSSAFPHDHSRPPHVADPMLPILRAILGAFPEDAFAAHGAMQSMLAARVRRSSQRREGPLELANRASRTLRHDIRQSANRAPLHAPRRPSA